MNRIKSFGNKETELIYNQKITLAYPLSIQKVALRKLIMLDNSESINDLRVPPGNHLEKLYGSDNLYSIRINQKYRLVFHLTTEGYEKVVIIDYH